MSISDFLSVERMATESEEYFMEVPSSLVEDEWVRVGEITLSPEIAIVAFNDDFLSQVSLDLGTYNEIELMTEVQSCVSAACFQLSGDDILSLDVRVPNKSWRGTYNASDGHVTLVEGAED